MPHTEIKIKKANSVLHEGAGLWKEPPKVRILLTANTKLHSDVALKKNLLVATVNN